MHLWPSLLLSLALGALAANAEDAPKTAAEPASLEGTGQVLPPSPPESSPFPVEKVSPDQIEGAAPADEPAPVPRVVPLPKASPRFERAEDPTRFRRVLTGYCRVEPLGDENADQIRYFPNKAPVVVTAGNKQGSLLLLLYNYSELLPFSEACKAARKRDPEACVQHGRPLKPFEVKDHGSPYTRIHSRTFWESISTYRAPAGILPRIDLLEGTRLPLLSVEDLLRRNFFELRDLDKLEGSPGSEKYAAEMAEAVREVSVCATRAIVEKAARPRKPASR